MKIAVIGAGAIGGLVAGYLKLKQEEVSLVGHPAAVLAIKKSGLEISGVRGELKIGLPVQEKMDFNPDLAIFATKSQDLEGAIKENLDFLKGSLILTAQNGVQSDNICAKYLPKENIISGIVMFGSTSLEPGKIIHNFEGNWIIGKPFTKNDDRLIQVQQILDKAFPTVTSDNIKGMKYLKVFVNANNCIPGILGISMQEAFSDLGISRISMAIWKEGLKVINQAGINLVSLPDFPLDRLIKLTSMPIDAAAGIYSGIMKNLSREPLFGSIYQSIKRGKSSEVDYINGEFVKLAKDNNFLAPLNEKLVKMVHQVERSSKFFTKEELIKGTEEFVY